MVLLGGIVVGIVGVRYALDGALGPALLFVLVGLLNLALVADSIVVAEFGHSPRGGGIRLGYVDELTQWATEFPYRWSVEIGVRVFWLLALVAFGPLALRALRADDVLVFAGAFLLFGLALVVLVRAFRGRLWGGGVQGWRGKLALTSEGVYHRWWLYSVFLPWQHISGIRAGARAPYALRFGRRSVSKPGPLIELEVASPSDSDADGHVLSGTWLWWPLPPSAGRMFGGGSGAAGRRRLTVSALAADSVLVYRSLRFYHQHPELRWELGTHVAAERFHNQDLHDPTDG
ncbi:hypothetical protein [Flindersiella endophytica]